MSVNEKIITDDLIAADPLEHLGLDRHVDVALRLHIPRSQAVVASRSLGALIAEIDGFAARVAGLEVAADRIDLTLAISLGTTDQIRVAAPASVRSVQALHRIVDEMSSYAPALVSIPAPASAEAQLAARLVDGQDMFAWITAAA